LNNFDWSERYDLLVNDQEFVEKFDKFIQSVIEEIRLSEKVVIKVDQRIYKFIEDYVVKKRTKKINKILRKKDI
jgi:hypothetical protein